MTYRVEVHSGVSNYLRGLEGLTREGRLAMNGFLDVLRDYGDEAREGCPRQSPGSTFFRLRWTFDAGPAIRSLDLYLYLPRLPVYRPRQPLDKSPGEGAENGGLLCTS